jgi:pyruvate formate lyase activating enzyme
VKLDTNGTHPDMLRGILSEGLADYVAMDIKAGRSNYSAVTGTLRPGLDAVSRSVEILKSCDTEHEFRTTVVRELHSDIDFEDIADWLAGEKRYFLQEFKDSGDLVSDGCSACGAEEMDRFLSIVRRTIPGAAIRGMD